MEIYLSDLIGNPVHNQSKERIGTLSDLVITDLSKPHPRIVGLILNRGRKGFAFVPEHDITLMSPKSIKLDTDVVDLTPFLPRNDEVLLVKDVYDKQIVDIDDRRLTRVNDLILEIDKGVIRLTGVDVSAVGLLARLKVPNVGGLLQRNLVDWADVQFLGGQSKMKFNVQYKNLESLHPVDIARIIFEGPGYKQGSRVLASLKDPIAADIIEELSPKLQKNLIEAMKIEDVADVVNHMPPHKAADLLITLGSDYAQKINPLLDNDHAKKIQTLLNYPEYSTGAYMNTDYIAVAAGKTIDQVFTQISSSEQLPDFMLYFYVLENELSNKLVGVTSIYELLTAERRNRIDSVMFKNLITIHPHENIKEALKRMYRYNLSALPVISKENKLLGIVTFRDAISIYLPKRWKVRIRNIAAS
jgi:CBS domain-containing protein/sporulation protein YlmC with PRC-barrel domain